MASVVVLGFISLSPTYKNSGVSAIRIRPDFSEFTPGGTTKSEK